MATVKNSTVYQQNTYFTKHSNNNLWVANRNQKQLQRSRTGNSNPNWQDQILNHTNAGTSLSGVYKKHRRYPVEAYCEQSVIKYWVNGQLAGHRSTDPGYSSILSTVALQRAHTKFRKQLIGVLRQMNGAVFLGELREAIRMIRHPAESLRKALKTDYIDRLKKRKKADPKHWKKAIPSTWLEACFGWSPFVHDLEDASSAYDELCMKAERYAPLRAFGREDKQISASSPALTYYSPVGNMQFGESGYIFDSAKARVMGEAKATAKVTTLDYLRPFGLTPGEFVPTVWELLPWSFLVDYFSNVGDILELSCSDTARFAWAMQTVILERNKNYGTWFDAAQQARISGYQYKGGYSNHASSNWSNRNVSRAQVTDISIPPLTFELPGRPAQWANMTALFALATQTLHPQQSRAYRLINGRPHFRR